MSNNILLSAIVPHPPIIIPEIGKEETKKTKGTIEALEKLSKEIVDIAPETVVIVTPHSILNPYFFSVYTADELNGSFDNFGAPEVYLEFNNDKDFIEELEKNIKEDFVRMSSLPDRVPLDHGSLVPLYYLAKAGYNNKVVIINYCALGKNEHKKFGELIKITAENLDRKTVFLASGDLSHKLTPAAPAGFDPDAHLFDELISEKIKTGEYKDITNMQADLRQKAGECGYNSLMVAFGINDEKPLKNEILSYEAPFGVGYIVARL